MTRSLVERYGGWALVTGASSGLGRCYALALARRGFPVIITARRRDRLDELSAAIRGDTGVDTCVVPLDLSQPGAARDLVQAVGDRDVGFLVNNAGFGFNGNFTSAEPELYEQMVTLNCVTPVVLARLLVRRMLKRRRGAVIMLSSTAAFQPVPYLATYAATKAFDMIFGEGLYAELRGTGIDVLNVCPGVTKTEFSEKARSAPETRGAEPEDVVEQSLRRLGKSMTWIHGVVNKIGPQGVRFVPRKWVARINARVIPPILLKKGRDFFLKELDRQAETS